MHQSITFFYTSEIHFFPKQKGLFSLFWMVLTQVSGPSGQMSWIRGGPNCLDAWNITTAIDNRFVIITMLVNKNMQFLIVGKIIKFDV